MEIEPRIITVGLIEKLPCDPSPFVELTRVAKIDLVWEALNLLCDFHRDLLIDIYINQVDFEFMIYKMNVSAEELCELIDDALAKMREMLLTFPEAASLID